MSDGTAFMEVRGFNNRSPERPSARPQQQQPPLQTLIQLRRIEEDHASLQQQHQALRGLAIDQATKNEELQARNMSLEASLKEARANEKQARDDAATARQHAADLGRQLVESQEQAQRRATDDSLKHWGLSVELEQSQERARRASAGEAAARRESVELREALATSDARLRMSEQTSAFAASLERASNLSAAAAAAEAGEVGSGGKGLSRSPGPSTGETGAGRGGGVEHSSSSMPLATDATARPAPAPAPVEEPLFGPPLQPLLSRASGAVAAATAGASMCSTPRSGSFRSSYLSTGSRTGSRAGSRRPSCELEDAGGAGATPSWSIGGSSASLVTAYVPSVSGSD